MQVNIERYIHIDDWNEYSNIISDAYLKKLTNLTITHSKYHNLFDEVELSIILTNNDEIQDINRELRGKDNPTNIISIQVEEFWEDMQKQQYMFLGDLVLSINKIKEESQEWNNSFINHFTHLVIHGILHLMGYDHIEESEGKEMESIEIKVLQLLNIPSPY